MIESYAASMTEYATQLTRCWEDGMTVDMLDEMVRMSTAIAGKALFGAEVEEEAEAINQALQDALSLFGRIAIPYSEQLLQLPLPGSIRFRRAKARLDATIDQMIEKRRNTDLDNGDLLSILLQENEAGGMSDQQIRDEALTLFLTAFDTTSLALTWTWYLLAQNPEAEAELQAEVDQVLEGRTPTVEDLPQLKYTRMVLGESMRVRPPLYVISRQARETFQLGSYTIPAGSILLISPYLIHHDPRFRPNPDQFDPHSWDKHAQQASSKYEYIPFSRGPRACIGESFAWMEGVLVLATIAQSWHLKLVPGHPVEFLQLINLRPKYGMKMTVHRRDRKA
ncbi:MAG: cytochrome P450 [Phaeodactylibacter sp.]|nr:cytochrome P450 [Phaeodactylibacter sp.]